MKIYQIEAKKEKKKRIIMFKPPSLLLKLYTTTFSIINIKQDFLNFELIESKHIKDSKERFFIRT